MQARDAPDVAPLLQALCKERNRSRCPDMTISFTLTESELTQSLSYAGFILLSYELAKRLIIEPIKSFYANASFGEGMPFSSYEKDVKSRHKNDLQACLLYLRDFMEAIDSEDVLTIQAFREHRNKLAHELPASLNIRPQDYVLLLEKVDKALFKLSNHNVFLEIGADPELRAQDIDWASAYGPEYRLFREIIEKVRAMGIQVSRYA